MRGRTKKIIAFVLVTIFCVIQTGCKFVYFEEEVLTNPRTEVADSSETEQEEETDVPAEETDISTATTTTVNKEPALSGSLEIQIFTNESASSGDVWTTVLNDFEELTGVKVTAYIGSQVNTQMTKRWMGGNPPDLALLDGSGIPVEALETSGALYEVTDLLKNGYVYGTNEKIWDVTNHNIFDRMNESDHYYRSGFMAAAYGTLYDENYLKQLGVTAPSNYDELMNTFLPATKAKGAVAFTTYGTTGSYPTWSMVMPALAAYGQDYVDDVLLGKKSAWQTPEVRSVFERWYTFCNTPGAMLDGTATFDHTISQMKWLKHDAALIGNGIWLPWEVENTTPSDFAMSFKTSPLTLAGQKPAVLTQSTSMIIASKAKNLENAKAFVRYLYTKEVQAKFVASYGYIGARTDMNYANVSGLSAASKRILQYIYSDQVTIVWKRFNWGDLNDTVNGMIQGMMTGKTSVDAAINELSTKGN